VGGPSAGTAASVYAAPPPTPDPSPPRAMRVGGGEEEDRALGTDWFHGIAALDGPGMTADHDPPYKLPLPPRGFKVCFGTLNDGNDLRSTTGERT